MDARDFNADLERAKVPDVLRARTEFFNRQATIIRARDRVTPIPINFPAGTQGTYVSTETNVGAWMRGPFYDTGLFYEVEDAGKELRDAASDAGRTLARITAPKIKRRKVASRMGPGRVRPRVVTKMQQDARKGIPPSHTAKPYKRTKSTMTPRQPLTCGVLVDESFSMDSMSRTAAAFAWVMSRAVQHAGGKVAQATFGFDAHPVIGPGERLPDRYVIRKMIGGYHQIGSGFMLLDSALDLVDSPGARLLVVFADNAFEDDSFLEMALEFEESGGAIFVVLPSKGNSSLSGQNQAYPSTTEWIDCEEIDGVDIRSTETEVCQRNAVLLMERLAPMLERVVNKSLGL